MLLVPFASNFWAYSATFSSTSRSFFRLLSSISVIRVASAEAAGGSSDLFGESSLTDGLESGNRYKLQFNKQQQQQQQKQRQEKARTTHGIKIELGWVSIQLAKISSSPANIVEVLFCETTFFEASTATCLVNLHSFSPPSFRAHIFK